MGARRERGALHERTWGADVTHRGGVWWPQVGECARYWPGDFLQHTDRPGNAVR